MVDLCSAFFSIPVRAETQPLFAFTFKGVDRPVVFSAAVKRVLNTVTHQPSTVCLPQLLSTMCLQVLDLRPQIKNCSGCHYLGHIISPGLKAISAERMQLQSFLGLVNYCHAWIPDCAYHDEGLRCLIQHGMGPRDSLNWTSESK